MRCCQATPHSARKIVRNSLKISLKFSLFFFPIFQKQAQNRMRYQWSHFSHRPQSVFSRGYFAEMLLFFFSLFQNQNLKKHSQIAKGTTGGIRKRSCRNKGASIFRRNKLDSIGAKEGSTTI